MSGASSRLRRMATMALGAIVVIAVGGAGANLGMSLKLKAMRVSERTHEAQAAAALGALTTLQKQSELDILQVQDGLIDVAATQGKAGLDGGFAEADRHASALRQDIAEAKDAASRLSAPELAGAYDRVADDFTAFYDLGQKTAHAYVAGGPAAGNALMADFHGKSDALRQAVAGSRLALEARTQALDAAHAAAEGRYDALQNAALGVALLCALVSAVATIGLLLLLRGRVFAPLTRATAALRALADGDVGQKLPGEDRPDEMGDLARAFTHFRRTLLDKAAAQADADAQRALGEEAQRLAQAARDETARHQAEVVTAVGMALARLSAGDVASRLDQPFPEAYEALRQDFNAAVTALQGALGRIAGASGDLRAGADEIAAASGDLAKRTEAQAANLEETASALDQITATVRRTASDARQAHEAVAAAGREAAQSGGVVTQAQAAMGQIEDSSSRIGQIIGVIDEIAFQTNLLALNAGVEAARAGDAGRGFAVVASEVRLLAQRSADAAKEIKALVSASTRQVGEGVDLVGAAGAALGAIAARVGEIETLVDSMAGAAQEQASALQQVNAAVGQMDRVVQQNAAMVEQTTAAARTLKEQADDLEGLVDRFELGQPPAAWAPPQARPLRNPGPARSLTAARGR
ncbi:methyl-accepting chemotaxis protein [Caulobacter sp. KR2-114]|uniref:methyl-accepting chemotaxis protein n=1 Tax=Caulobacter sp. KR2-114 TaxID=3400912 RepID=UPI003C05E62B